MYIHNLKITGLFKYLNYDIRFNSGINIIHGINGKGKTTILNIITNVLNGDLTKFYYLSFKELEIEFNEGTIKIYRDEDNTSKLVFDFTVGKETFLKRDVKNYNSIHAFLNRIRAKPLLLPAQRVSIQETYYLENEDDFEFRRNKNMYARDRFYREEKSIFQPNPKMVDILSIPRELIERARKLSLRTTRSFANIDMIFFERFFESVLLSESAPTTFDADEFHKKLNEIKAKKEVYFHKYKKLFLQSRILETLEKQISNTDVSRHSQIVNFIKLYSKNIDSKNSVVSKYISPFSNLEKIINVLFEGKKINLSINEDLNNIFKIISKSNDEIQVQHLSSGEKNLLLIFFHFLFEIDERTIFMIDEPELSLHIDWQYSIIKNFQEYSSGNQMIIVTHSPDIMQNHTQFGINLDKCIIEEN